MKYSFTVSDPSEVDFGRIIAQCNGAQVIMLKDCTETPKFLIADNWRAQFLRGDDIKVGGENIAAVDFGHYRIDPIAWNGGIRFDTSSGFSNNGYCIPGYRVIAGDAKKIIADISAARAFIPRRKVTVETL